jgi:hypothetical protein
MCDRLRTGANFCTWARARANVNFHPAVAGIETLRTAFGAADVTAERRLFGG